MGGGERAYRAGRGERTGHAHQHDLLPREELQGGHVRRLAVHDVLEGGGGREFAAHLDRHLGGVQAAVDLWGGGGGG